MAAKPQPQPLPLLRHAEALADLADLDLAEGKADAARTHAEEAEGIANALPTAAETTADLTRLRKRLKARAKP